MAGGTGSDSDTAESSPNPGSAESNGGNWENWTPQAIAQAIWDDRQVPARDMRVPKKATLHTHPQFERIFEALFKLISDNPPKGYEVHSLAAKGKRGECRAKGLALREIGPSKKPVPGTPFRFLCLCTPECAYMKTPGRVSQLVVHGSSYTGR